jgi:SNF2 family DNA or RNA helicase
VVAKYKFKTEPFDHQRKALEVSWNKESFALFMEMGTGKTKVLIDNIGVLFTTQDIDSALIIATKSVYTIWVNDEIPKHINIPCDFLQKHDALVGIDESSTIKNIKAIRTRNLIKLRPLTKYRRILTGTPITKSPIDIYSQCEFLDPKHLNFPTFTAFKNRYCIFEMMHTYGDKQIAIPIGFKNLEELENKIKAFS